MSMSQAPDPSLPGPAEGPARALAFDVEAAGRYVRIGLLGQGGMGRVYLARDTRLERDVALKEVLHERPDTAARLVREALLTAELDHPGIVPVYDAGRTVDGRLFYTMRLVRGRRLGDLVREASSLEDRLRLVPHVRDVARALAFAHERDVVHRDVKPDNVLIGPLGETQLSDWGLARRLTASSSPGTPGRTSSLADAALTTPDGALVGTTRYAAPELARGGPATRRSDVFSLGALLLEVVTGAPPWGAASGDEVLAKLRAGEGPPLALPLGTPPALATILRRALAVEPQARAASAAELAADLTALLDGRLVSAHAYSARELLSHFVRAWRVPLLAAGSVLVVALAALAAAGFVARRERDRALDAERATRARTAALLVQRARELDATDAVAEMEHLAAQAAALEPGSADALGVLMATAAMRSPRLVSTDDAPACRLVQLHPRGALCALDDAVAALDERGRERWRVPLVARRLAVDALGREALVLVGEEAWRLSLRDGATTRLGGIPPYAVGLGLDERLGAWGFNPGLLRWFWWGLTREVQPCADGVELLGVLPVDGALELLCSDGELRRLAPLELMRASPSRSLERSAGETTRLGRPELLAGATTFVAEDVRHRLVGTVRGTVVRVDVTTGETRVVSARPHLGPLRQVLALEAGLLLIGERGGPELVERHDGGLRGALPAWSRGPARVNPASGSSVVVAGTADGHRRFAQWDLSDVSPGRQTFPVGLSSVTVDPSGEQAVVAGAEGFVARWALSAPAVTTLALGLTQVVKSVALSPGATRLVVGAVGLPGIAVVEGERVERLGALPAMRRVGWLADGTGWALGYELGPLLHDTTRWLDAPPPSARQWVDGSTTSDGAGVVMLDASGDVSVATRASLAHVFSAPGASAVVARSVAGPFFTAHDGVVRASTGERVRLDEGFVTALALSADGRWLAIGSSTGALLVASAADLRVVARAPLHRDRIAGIAFSREDLLVTVGWDRVARAWSLAPLRAPPQPNAVAARWGLPSP